MDFQELGLTLRQEREKKGLTIEMVMEATKISRTNIVAMESGDRNSLPHPVYTKGFVKSYARYLGLDATELSMAVDQEYQDESDGPEEHIYEVEPAAEKAFQTPDTPERKGKSKWPLFLLVVALIVVVVLLVMNLNGSKDSEEVKQEQTSSEIVEQTPAEEPVAEAENEVLVEEQAAEAEEAAIPEQEAETTDEAMNEDVTPAQEETPAPAEEITQTEPAVEPEPKPESVVENQPEEKPAFVKPEGQKYDHEVVIRATTEKGCWIGLWKGDEKNMYRDYVLTQGEPLRLMFNTKRRIRIGNVAGVTVTYNGQPYQLTGTGNIQTLSFGE